MCNRQPDSYLFPVAVYFRELTLLSIFVFTVQVTGAVNAIGKDSRRRRDELMVGVFRWLSVIGNGNQLMKIDRIPAIGGSPGAKTTPNLW